MRRVCNCISAYASPKAGPVIHHIRGADFCVGCSISLFEMQRCAIPGRVCLAVYDMMPEVSDVYAVNWAKVRRMSGASAGDERTQISVFTYVNARCISAETRVTLLRMSPVETSR